MHAHPVLLPGPDCVLELVAEVERQPRVFVDPQRESPRHHADEVVGAIVSVIGCPIDRQVAAERRCQKSYETNDLEVVAGVSSPATNVRPCSGGATAQNT